MGGGTAGNTVPVVYFVFNNVAALYVVVNAATITTDYRFDFSLSYTANF